MAAIMLNAANMAYRRAIRKTREKTLTNPDVPAWLVILSQKLPEDDRQAASKPVPETARHYKERVLKDSVYFYNRLAWFVYDKIVTKNWFEAFVMVNILMIGVATGVDLENAGRDQWTIDFIDVVAMVTTVVFTVECVVKIVSEGREPWKYFTTEENGAMNTFDFAIVVANFAFLGDKNGSAIGALRMLRLVRLLTFVKGVPQLRVIIVGLIQGVQSVVYIVMLLFIVIYLFAILGTLLFGVNDPAHFGIVRISMVTLFQVSTLASWSSIAYVSWFGCDSYLGSPYAHEDGFFGNPSRILSPLSGSTFEGFRCDDHGRNTHGRPVLTGIFFAFYILFTAWVIMSLFIGVISMGMFEAFLRMKDETKAENSRLTHEANTEMEYPGKPVPRLKALVDECMDDDLKALSPPKSALGKFMQDVVGKRAKGVRDSELFNNLITVAIMVVGIMIGVDTDLTMRCERADSRLDFEDPTDDDETPALKRLLHDCKHGTPASRVITLLSQVTFTFEMVVKVLAESNAPWRYFTDEENGSWNCLDFVVVFAGFAEMTPAAFAFEAFPVVVLRLLRLLRVFRLAKTLPRLRSIVEALISGFSAVGWICSLIVVFDYIAACVCMLMFQTNDPFHFGSVGRAMFTILRIETLDTWDQILYVNMYGCDGFPSGYPLLSDHPNAACEEKHSYAWGWVGFLILFIIAIIGAYVLPTVLVGIISIKFDETSNLIERSNAVRSETERVVVEAKAFLPTYLTDDRLRALRELFLMMDGNNELTLDVLELTPFLYYTFDKLFGVEMTSEQVEQLFQIMDMSRSTSVGFDEFVQFISIIKGIELKCRADSAFGADLFGEEAGERLKEAGRNPWNAAMLRVDLEATEQAWDTILLVVNGEEGEDADTKIRKLFKDFDSDGSMILDMAELRRGLKSIGVALTERQTRALIRSMDTDGDQKISCLEFLHHITQVTELRDQAKIQKAAAEARDLIKQVDNHEKRKTSIHEMRPSMTGEDKKCTKEMAAAATAWMQPKNPFKSRTLRKSVGPRRRSSFEFGNFLQQVRSSYDSNAGVELSEGGARSSVGSDTKRSGSDGAAEPGQNNERNDGNPEIKEERVEEQDTHPQPTHHAESKDAATPSPGTSSSAAVTEQPNRISEELEAALERVQSLEAEVHSLKEQLDDQRRQSSSLPPSRSSRSRSQRALKTPGDSPKGKKRVAKSVSQESGKAGDLGTSL